MTGPKIAMDAMIICQSCSRTIWKTSYSKTTIVMTKKRSIPWGLQFPTKNWKWMSSHNRCRNSIRSSLQASGRSYLAVRTSRWMTHWSHNLLTWVLMSNRPRRRFRRPITTFMQH
jgi:hypothetical protein